MPYNPDTNTWSRPVPSMTQTFETMEEAQRTLMNSGYDRFLAHENFWVWRHRDGWSAFLNRGLDPNEIFVTYIRD